MGGSMMGIALDSDAVPVTRTTNCIVAATQAELGPRVGPEALPCIRCGECASVCPAHLMPQELHRAGEHGQLEMLESIGLFDCIECGCCDVVCPSHIPLTESFRASKHAFVHAMEPDDRVRWLGRRDALRRERIERWMAEHGSGADAGREPPAPRDRAAAVADVIARLSRLPESTGA